MGICERDRIFEFVAGKALARALDGKRGGPVLDADTDLSGTRGGEQAVRNL